MLVTLGSERVKPNKETIFITTFATTVELMLE